MDGLAGDVAGIRSDEKADQRGDLIGQGKPAERHAGDGALPAGWIERGMRAVILARIAGDDAVDGDARGGELRGERARQPFEPGLGRGRGGKPFAVEAEDMGNERAHRDDAPGMRREKMRAAGVAEAEEPRGDDGERALETGIVERAER